MPTVAELNQSPTLVRFTSYGALNGSELAALFPLVAASRRLPKGAYVQHEGERSSGIHLLLEGWTASSISARNAKRQLLKIHVAGDLIGLPGLPYESIPDTVVALTPIVIARIELAALRDLFREQPRLAAVLFLISQEERLMLMDRLFLVGGQEALGRLAGLILQLRSRLMRRFPDLSHSIELPLTQGDLADLLGITTVHMNRTLREMERRNIMTWARQTIEIHDLEAMQDLSGLPERVLHADHTWLPEPV